MSQKDAASMPGAGTYQIPSRMSEGPKYGMGAKIGNDNSPMKNNPGPGQYNL